MKAIHDIRPMTAEDIETALDWAAAEGWNPGLEDGPAFRAVDPAGFLMGWRGSTPVSCISVVNHAPDFAFLGFYIVRPDHRGRGFGRRIWEAGMAHAGGRTIGLDGVPAQQANYARSGFAPTHRTLRHEGRLDGRPGARSFAPSDLPRLLTLDTRATGAARRAYMTAWSAPSETRRTLVADTGHGTIRRCREGAKIGPLMAATLAEAQTLMAALAALFPGERLIVDVPDHAEAFRRWLEGEGFTVSFETARMVRGRIPPREGALIFGEATLELG